MRWLKVEPYHTSDRVNIRRICCEVAYAGRPLEEWLTLDRELFADLFTRYYTDFEADSVFVARCDNRVAGYVFACLDTARYRCVWRRHVLLPALAHVIRGRYAFPMKALPRLTALAIAYARGGGLHAPWREFPGHLHINTAPDYRGCVSLSRMLLHRAFAHFTAHGVTRIHGVVMTSRARMEEKYERLGFRVAQCRRAPRRDARGDGACWLVLTMDLATMPPLPLATASLRTRVGGLAPGLGGH